MKLPLFLGAALAAAAPLAAQTPPALSDLGLLAGDAAAAASADEQSEPAIARSDDGYLVVWTDLRGSLSGGFAPDGTDRDVFAARLDAAGALIDTTPIVVTADFGDQEKPQVAWNGAHWLVTWVSQAPTPTYHAAAIEGARIAPSGALLDDPPLTILAYPWSSAATHSVASDGNGWVTVSQGSSAAELRCVRVTAQGDVVDPGGQSIYTPPYLVPDIDVAYASNVYLVTWTQSGVRGLRLRTTLEKLDASPLSISGSSHSFSSANASNGTSFFVAWAGQGATLAEKGRIHATRLAADGTVLDPNGKTLVIGTTAMPAGTPGPVWDGAGWATVFSSKTVGLVRMDTSGNVLDPAPVVVAPASAGDQYQPAVGGGLGDGVAVVWSDKTNAFDGDVVGTHLAPSLAAGPQVDVSRGTPRQIDPSLTEGNGTVLATWISETASTRRVLMQRLDARGNALAEPVLVDQGPDVGGVSSAWNGSRWMLAWENGGILFFRRFDPALAPIDPFPGFAMVGREPAVAAAGSTFVLAGTHAPLHVHQRNVYAVRIDAASGAVLDAAPLFLGGAYARRPEARPFGDYALVVWQRNVTHDNPAAAVRGALVGAGGSTTSLSVANPGYRPSAVANGASQAIVVYDAGGDVRARRLASGGAFLDAAPFDVCAEPEAQGFASVGWTGSEYVVAWEDLRNREAFFDLRTDLYAARVSDLGTVADPAGFPLATGRDPERRPAVVGSAGAPVIASMRFAREAPHATYRVQIRGFGEWSSLGSALAGTPGLPALSGSGALAAGSTLTLSLVNAAPSAPGLHVVGIARLDIPLLGGLLVPTPDALVPFTTDGQGAAGLTQLLANTPSVPLYVQSWIVDAGAPWLVAASNAIYATP